MGTGWRRAFCTTIPRDPDSKLSDKQQKSTSPSPSPISCSRLGFFSSSSNPSTPRLQSNQPSPSLRCRTISETIQTRNTSSVVNESPGLECKTNTPKTSKKSPRTNLLAGSDQTSPRSPLKLSLFKNSFKFRSSCGICLNSVKTGQGTAIYTAECSHAFHFPCIATHVRKHGSLVCPVCNITWKDVPLLAVNNNIISDSVDQNDMSANNTPKPKTVDIKEMKEVKLIKCSPRASSNLKVSDSRSYDDDEPLLSPTIGGRIIPIPEADEKDAEEAENDVEEFQGFFVNPKPSSSSIENSDNSQITGRELRNNVQVKLLPEVVLISANQNHEIYAVALSVKAPRPPAQNSTGATLLEPSHRAPIDLVTVLDVSGSMTGAKLYMLKRAMRLVISSLGSADRLSIVAFSAGPKRLLPLRRMTAQGQRAARRIVDRLICGQGTSVGVALRKATKVLEDRREKNPVASIMLLSDGQDDRVRTNMNNQRQGPSHVSSTRFSHIEIPVHAFGLGNNAGYSHSHEPVEDAFAKCVGGLLSVVVQDLRIQLGFPSSPAPAEISAIYSCGGQPTILGSGSVRVGDLYAEEEKELLVELRLPISAAGTHHLMSVRCIYKDPATQEVIYDKGQAVLVPPPSAVRSSSAKIERMRNLFICTRAIAESRRLVEHGDVTSAHDLLASARDLLMQSNSIAAEEYVRGLEVELAELHWKRQNQVERQQQVGMIQRRRASEKELTAIVDENGEPLTPTSAWRAAEKLAKLAMMKKSLNEVSDLHGFENARF